MGNQGGTAKLFRPWGRKSRPQGFFGFYGRYNAENFYKGEKNEKNYYL